MQELVKRLPGYRNTQGVLLQSKFCESLKIYDNIYIHTGFDTKLCLKTKGIELLPQTLIC